MEAASPSEHNEEMDLMAEMPSGEYDGGAKHTLMDHLKNPLKGFGAYLHELEGGLQTGAYEGEGQTGGGSGGASGGASGGLLGRTQRKRILPGRTRKAAPAEEPKEAPVEEPVAAVVGGRKKRAPAGPEDGRRKRAAIVKKVMAEKGMSMIEASKYVKAHSLY